MTKYGKDCAVGGGLLYLFTKVPILKNLVIVGGLGY